MTGSTLACAWMMGRWSLATEAAEAVTKACAWMGGPENVPLGLAGRRVDRLRSAEAATGCSVDDTAATAAAAEPDPLVVVLGTTGCDDDCAVLVDVLRW